MRSKADETLVIVETLICSLQISQLKFCLTKLDCRDVQELESEPELSKFFRSRIGLGVKFNVKTGVGVGAGVTIF